MTSEISASFALTGVDLNPDEITTKAGITPTRTCKKGDLINPKDILRYKENGWSIQSTLDKSENLEDHIKSVLEQLQENWTFFIETSQKYYAEIACVIYIKGQTPEIHFDKEILQKFSQLNAEIDVDLYVLPEETFSVTESTSVGVEHEQFQISRSL